MKNAAKNAWRVNIGRKMFEVVGFWRRDGCWTAMSLFRASEIGFLNEIDRFFRRECRERHESGPDPHIYGESCWFLTENSSVV